ncbi:hypothetical protein [Amycolatopsis sp. NPDC098790]|uniref:hypothetical protein n=1 Tax=Amycolatopsis sp. NPDC098790 TaxID=3363939 RepID=UPI0038269989
MISTGDLIIAGSQFRGSRTELYLIVGSFVVVGLTAAGVFLFVRGRLEKNRRAGIASIAQLLDGRPFACISYAECPLSVPDLLSMAQARGYALTPNPAASRYEFVLGAPQTAFTGHPRAAYIAHMLDGRPDLELPIVFEPMSLPELMVVAHSRGYTVQKSDRVYAFMRHQERP